MKIAVTSNGQAFLPTMSAAVALQSPDFSRNSSHGIRVHHTISSSWAMVSSKSTPATKEKELSEDLRKLSTPETDKFSPLNIKFDRLQRADQVAIQGDGLEYGQFVAREAQIDEEYWAAAWLRADAHWENQENDRYAESYKKKFAEQEFNSLKTRCKAQLEEKCNCIVMANKEDRTVKHNAPKSVIGTVDLSYGYLSHGQSFPGERIKAPLFGFVDRKPSSKFGYIANLCVAKSARRKGIARNMLQFAISLAKEHGVKQVFVHVHGNNKPAQVLYQKMEFEVVDAATFQLSSHQTYLLCFENSNY
ncbi:GCN5-related N-acetyltransferase 6, chloroplastic-like isoform X2 [Primulina huaijiensis]|uniref:GCN5-related N-acetyltransferase 6, chloroplastic-like isoform X2 n=1 Tax=Primulina huaijiensis TaxID=1492673 RepID=UPI003CC74B65